MTITDYTALGHSSGYLASVVDGTANVVWIPIEIPDEHRAAFNAAYLEGLEAARAARMEEEGDRP